MRKSTGRYEVLWGLGGAYLVAGHMLLVAVAAAQNPQTVETQQEATATMTLLKMGTQLIVEG